MIQIIRQGASGKAPVTPRSVGLSGKAITSAPLAQISPTYRLRYSHEHGYRFDKQELLWDVPRLSTPQRTQRWTQIVACAHNLLVLARPLVESLLSTVGDTLRGSDVGAGCDGLCPAFCTQFGTPARPPQLRGKAPGQAKGFHPKLRDASSGNS